MTPGSPRDRWNKGHRQLDAPLWADGVRKPKPPSVWVCWKHPPGWTQVSSASGPLIWSTAFSFIRPSTRCSSVLWTLLCALCIIVINKWKGRFQFQFTGLNLKLWFVGSAAAARMQVFTVLIFSYGSEKTLFSDCWFPWDIFFNYV